MKGSGEQMSDDPNQTTKQLVKEHGLDGALEKAIEGATTAQQEGANYELSVWREVKQILREQKSKARTKVTEG
jgi:hypothetical protein